jgi:hypothetical protein
LEAGAVEEGSAVSVAAASAAAEPVEAGEAICNLFAIRDFRLTIERPRIRIG